MSSNAVFVLCAFLWLSLGVQLSSCWTLKTSPTLPTRVNHAVWESTTVTFQADVALVDCQCRTHRTENNETTPLMDFSQGVHAASYYHSSNSKWHYNASFGGPALELNGCGFKMSDLTYPFILVVCRARPSVGNWQYQQVALVLEDYALFPMTVQPPYQVILPGSSAVVICKAYRRLRYCGMLVPRLSKWLSFHSGHNSSAEDGVKYSGTSLREGHCGAEVTTTTNADSGPVWCYVDSYAGSMVSVMTSLVLVATPPSKVQLTFPYGTNVTAGNVLTATCTVSPSRPVANITWLLGTKVIRQDLTDDVIVADPAWVWPWATQSITQTLVHEVSTQDHGKELTCRANHLEPMSTLIQKQTISVLNLAENGLECGKTKEPEGQKLIAGGQDAEINQFPWHAVIYKKEGDLYEQICGGTLISTRVVISVAHCFWDGSLRKVQNVTLYKVAVGKVWRDFNASEVYAQNANIKEILVHVNYADHTNIQLHDIAVLKLETSFTLSDAINIACVDWNNLLTHQLLKDGKKGTLAGFGLTLNNILSEQLQFVELPWVSQSTCRNSTEIYQQKLIAFDKFCAGFVNRNTSPCKGDTGGGLLFKNDEDRFYLQGILSSGFMTRGTRLSTCNTQQYTLFTQVSTYVNSLITKDMIS